MPAMEPPIQYARTSDGFNIAYWTLGDGPPVIYLTPMPQHVQLDWRLPDIRDFYHWLSRRQRLVRFDFRGRGLSQRGEIEFTHETELLDLEAVSSGSTSPRSHSSAAAPTPAPPRDTPRVTPIRSSASS